MEVKAALRTGATILMLLAGYASASADVRSEAASIDSSLNSCREQAASDMYIADCARNYLEQMDRLLNRFYQQAVTGAYGQKLKLAQRAWIPFRDANCDMEASAFEGGTYESINRDFCLFRLTKQRIDELGDFISQ
jgi:uncharacterized protein YecT (DUF1311 family)